MAEPVKPTPRPKKSVHERRSAQVRVPREKVSAIDPHHLIGLEPGAVQQLLGPPGRVENGWTMEVYPIADEKLLAAYHISCFMSIAQFE